MRVDCVLFLIDQLPEPVDDLGTELFGLDVSVWPAAVAISATGQAFEQGFGEGAMAPLPLLQRRPPYQWKRPT